MRYVALVISAFLLSSAAVGLVEAGDLLFASGGVSPANHNCQYAPPCPHPPSVPQNVQATPGDTQVTLSWTAPLYPGGSAIINYKVYRGTAPGTAIHVADAGTSLSHVDTGLLNGQPYYYQVSAVNEVMGEGSRSPEVSATPAAPTAPSAPENLQATPGDAQVTLSWSAPPDGGSPIINYKVYRGTAPGTAIHVADAGMDTSYVDIGVVNGQPYYYQVSAVNAVDEGLLSAEVSATPTAGAADTVNPTISITSPTPGQELDSTSVAVTGVASDNVAVQKVELSTDGVSWAPAVGINPWSGTLTLVEDQNTIHARATDTSGNPATATVTVTVTLEAGGQFAPDPMILGIIAVVAAGAVAGVVALFLARRRKPRIGEGGRQS